MKQLDPILLTTDFNREMMMSAVNKGSDVFLQGQFHSLGDMGGLMYTVNDEWGHQDIAHEFQPNFKDIVLSYNYEQNGYLKELDESGITQGLTIYTAVGYHYLRLYNYMIDRPEDDWEKEYGLFPRGRSPGGGSQTKGRFVINFNELYAGFMPYSDLYNRIPNAGWYKIDPSSIIKILWTFPVINYKRGSKQPISGSREFAATFANWNVRNAREIGGEKRLPAHIFKMADGYDDNYNVTPERLIKQFHALGFRDKINMYIGASHYYDKQAKVISEYCEELFKDYIIQWPDEELPPDQSDGSEDQDNELTAEEKEKIIQIILDKINDNSGDVFNIKIHEDKITYEIVIQYISENGEYQYRMIPDKVFNSAAQIWLLEFFRHAKNYGFTEIVASVSMEITECPDDWRQRDCWGNAAVSGWTPATKFVSFTNESAKNYYCRYALLLADMQASVGLVPIIQHGEPWWWSSAFIAGTGQEGAPCFYDESTRRKFSAEKGRELPVYQSMWIEPYDEEAVRWLGEQVGVFTHMLRDTVKAKYTHAKMTVLFFPPTVMDHGRVGRMMREANFPADYWQSPQLDFFQVEDYDWVIDNDPKHLDVYEFAKTELGYEYEKTDYFSGFVLKFDPWTGIGLWKKIDIAAAEGVLKGMPTFIWAGAQIRRDRWQAKRVMQYILRPFPLDLVIGGVTMSLCTLWAISRRDGVCLMYTDYDQPIMVNNVGVFLPEPGFTRSAITFACDSSVDNVALDGVMSSEDITDKDILMGKYDYATVDIFFIDPEKPNETITQILRANLGEIEVKNGQYTAQIEGLGGAFSQTYGIQTTPQCTCQLGDERCRVNLNNIKQQSVIKSIISDTKFTIDPCAINNDFTHGFLEWVSGDNLGDGTEIQSVWTGLHGAEISLCLPPVLPMKEGDVFTITLGCDKTIDTCYKRFGNIGNFRGFPHIPGVDKVLWRGGQ